MYLMVKKIFILDTNILLSDSEALFSFEEHNVVLPLTVIEELDKHKNDQGEVGRNARETVRKLLDLTKNNKNVNDPIKLKTGGSLTIMSIDELGFQKDKLLPRELIDKDTGDNAIVAFCKALTLHHSKDRVILVTRDSLLRIKASVLKIECEDYRKSQATTSVSSLYSGHQTVEGDFDIEAISEDGFCDQDYEAFSGIKMYPNQYLTLQNGDYSVNVRYVSDSKPMVVVQDPPKLGKLEARNKEQKLALNLLLDPSIKLVTLAGQAGNGKTLVSIAAGLEQVLDRKKYKNLVILRPIQPVGKDVGFLPGTLEEKLEPWIAPIKDNLRFLLSGGGKRSKNVEDTLNYYFEDGTIEIEALTFIRGRSISNAFILIDEAQNLNAHELKTIITRVGEGTKIVLTGDIEQIDNTYVDSLSNGLTVAIEKFKDYSIAGHMTLVKGERSELASLAASIL